MRSALTAWLAAACAAVGSGCTEPTKTQVLTGKVTTRDAIAVRAIDGTTVVTAARVRSDGRFTLQLPRGHRYRLEVLTGSGVHNVVRGAGGALGDLAFEVCEPTDPFDMGGFGEPGCDPMTDPDCKPCGPNDPNCMPPPPCDPNDPACIPPCDANDPMCVPPPPCDPSDPNCMTPPPPCDPATDPDCKCYPGDPNCPPPCDPMTDPSCGGGGTCDPSDPNCVPPPCDPSAPMCAPPPCDPATDPNCKCDAWSGVCEPVPPPCDPNDPTCACQPGDPNCPTCDPMIDATCPTPPPPCEDPMDPNTCKDPCMVDPLSCGCRSDPGTMQPDGTISEDNTCWPPPEPCTSDSCSDPWTPENPPGDFGCGDGTAGGGGAMTPVDEDGTL